MTDKFSVPDNASIFNFKNAYNGLTDALSELKFVNRVLNQNLRSTRKGDILAWEASGLDINAGVVDSVQGTVTYTMPPGSWIRQRVRVTSGKIVYGTVVTALMQLSTTDVINVRLEGGLEDIGELDGSNDSTTSLDMTGGDVFVLRGRLRADAVDSSTAYNDTMYIYFQNYGASSVDISFQRVGVIHGDIAMQSHSFWNDYLRWNDDTSIEAWQITVDNGSTWYDIMIDDDYFVDRVGEIVYEQTFDLVHQDNIQGTGGITITYGSFIDGTGREWPTVIIDGEDVSGGSGSSSGSGDWTREDMRYQALLEDSDYSFSTYDGLQESGTVQVFGSASWSSATDVYGVGSITGGNGDGFVTKDLITETPDGTALFTSFYPTCVYTGSIAPSITYETSIDGTSGWTAPVVCSLNNINVVAGGFSHLRLTYTFNDPTTVYSFGILYGAYTYSAGSSIGFLERYTAATALPVSTEITIPGGYWYHKDGKSLSVFYNRTKLIAGLDYEEKNVGFSEKSDVVTFLIPIDNQAEIVFQEYYGYVDHSTDNSLRLDVDHYSTGHHRNNLSVFFVDGTLGSNSNNGLTVNTSWKTLDFALTRLDGLGGTQIRLACDQEYIIADIHSMHSTILRISHDLTSLLPKPTIRFRSTVFNVENRWGGIHLYNGTLRFDDLNIIIEPPANQLLPDNTNTIGIPFKNGLSNGVVHFRSIDFTIQGAPLFSNGFNGQVIDMTIVNSTITADRTYSRTFPLINFNDGIGGLYIDDVTLAGDASSWTEEVQGLSNWASNIRTNIEELVNGGGVYTDEDGTGNKYKIAVDGGVVILKPVY